ncbi:MAG: glycosyl transferase [Lachnospiraceae bacterium]|nr:glycosyl transferase [Lachnospiraceae bacterium]
MNIKRFAKILRKYITNSDYRFLLNARIGIYNRMPDKEYLKREFKASMGYELDLDNPKTFNEKLQWLKLNCTEPLYTKLVDKYEVKFYVSNKIGAEYIIPTIGVWEKFEDIDFETLPDLFVLKCTHDSGGVCMITTKDIKKSRKKLERCLKHNYYYYHREYPYKNVRPRIIAEKYIELSAPGCAEYKFFCCDGKVQWVMVCTGIGHTENRTNDGYTRDFVHIPVTFACKNSIEKLEKPAEFEKMVEIAERLSKGMIQVRIDMYLLNRKIYFGEFTFFHDAGTSPFKPEKYDFYFGQFIHLPKR